MATDWRVTATAGSEVFDAFLYWPDNVEWSTQLLRLFSYSTLGAADFSEVEFVARSLPEGDEQAWRVGFGGVAYRLDQRASTALAGGHVASALAAFARACIYYRLAATFLSMRGETEVACIEDSRRCFRAVLDLDEQVQSETIEIPYGVQTLPAYVVAPVGRSEPAPSVIVPGGIDAFAEEMYFKIGRALARQGFTVLLPDGPGQGESRRRRIPARYDYEVAISALVTYLSERPEVDSRRIALIGSSMGGYFAARGAAFEHRLCATVVWGAFYGIDAAHPPTARNGTPFRLGQAMAMFAVSDPHQLAAAVEHFNLEGVAQRITSPILILHGGSDVQVPLAHAQRLFEEVPHVDKQLIVYPPGQPGCTHCQLDSPLTAHCDILGWLDTFLGSPQLQKERQ